ncbi:hypothetical protein [Burkholderia sp. BCC1644]|uniref:hypothetical protein n=1 Tax=Burkholderia sp. BCC1644 TaxID=2676293 RepID=UPI001592AB09|nr:hypothetical protein [Burkholderia sp. BCC1644]
MTSKSMKSGEMWWLGGRAVFVVVDVLPEPKDTPGAARAPDGCPQRAASHVAGRIRIGFMSVVPEDDIFTRENRIGAFPLRVRIACVREAPVKHRACQAGAVSIIQ